MPVRLSGALGGAVGRLVAGALAFGAVLAGGASETQNAIANGDTRSLTFVHTHTKETATITFRRSGSYDRAALKQINWLLRDWRRDEPINMDPRLFDLVWEVHRELGSREAIHVLSAYRAPATNAMLRRRSGAVAEHSQHMLGKALDFYLPDVPAARIRAAAVRLQRGGVGFYPSSYNPFVHLDVGSVRAWPRLSHDQLARIFPDGKTVHVPANGRPLPGYDQARAEILARGGQVAGSTAYAAAPEQQTKGFWARLFGGADEGEDVAEARAIAAAPAYRPRSAREAAQTAQKVAYARDDTTGDSGLLGFMSGGRQQPARQEVARQEVARQAEVEAEAPQAPEDAPATIAQRMAPLDARGSRMPSMAPLPMARPQDAVAMASAQDPASASQGMTIIPLPPRRPDDPQMNMATAAADATGAAAQFAAAPLPPSRPQELVAARAAPAAEASPSPSAAVLAFAPFPAPRPNDLRNADLRPAPRPAAPPAQALAYAADNEAVSSISPLPPMRPTALRQTIQPQPAQPAPQQRPTVAQLPARERPARSAQAPAPSTAPPPRIAGVYAGAVFASDATAASSDGQTLAAALLARAHRKPD